MTITEQIRMHCAKINISQAELARRTGQTPQGFSAKMKRKSFSVDELDRIADATGSRFKRAFSFKNGDEV